MNVTRFTLGLVNIVETTSISRMEISGTSPAAMSRPKINRVTSETLLMTPNAK